MNTYHDTRFINISSIDGERLNGTKLSYMEFSFTGLLKDEPDIIDRQISVVDAEIPHSFLNINTNNNLLYYTRNTVAKLITLDEGNYNSQTLISSLQVAFADNGETNMLITINSLTGAIRFSSPNAITIQTANSSLHRVLGLEDSTDYTGAVIQAPFSLDLLGTRRISINSDELLTYGYDSHRMGYSHLLASCAVDVPVYNLIHFSNNPNNKTILRVKQIDKFDIQLKDENDQFIDLRNSNWTMTLVLDIVRLFRPESTTTFVSSLEKIGNVKKTKKEKSLDTEKETEPIDEDLEILTT